MVKVKGGKVIASFNLNTMGPHFLIFYVVLCPQQATVSCLSLEQENAVTNMTCSPLLPFFMQGQLLLPVVIILYAAVDDNTGSLFNVGHQCHPLFFLL